MSRKVVLLLDGDQVLRRHHHGQGNTRTFEGHDMGGLYGTIQDIRYGVRQWKADAACCIFDADKPTFRHDAYAAYKATREKTPEDIVYQKKLAMEIIPALGYAAYIHPGAEADDVITSMTREFLDRGWRVVVYSRDKDLYVLADHPDVTLWNMYTRSIQSKEWIIEKIGVEPRQITDYLALVGDATDNVPGVPGIGPKTAASFLSTFGTLENIIANLSLLQDRYKASLHHARQSVIGFRNLMTLDDQLPGLPTQNECKIKIPDTNKAYEMLMDWGWHDMIERYRLVPRHEQTIPG